MLLNVIFKNNKRLQSHPGPNFETVEVRRHSPTLVEVIAQACEQTSDAAHAFQPGDKIKVDVGNAMRSYTPSVLSASELRFFGVVHGGGPGSAWLGRLQPRDPVRFRGPARSLPFVEDVEWAGFFGDETTVGAAAALLGALPANVPRVGALEVEEDSVAAVRDMSLGLDVEARCERGDALIRYAEALEVPTGKGVLWLSGEATTLVRLKETLLARGVERSMLRIKAYWSVKGTVHRKALERGALR